MDINDLRKSMVEEVKESATAEEVEERTAENSLNAQRLLQEAKAVRTRFRAIGPSPERRKLQEIYQSIDALLTEMQQATPNANIHEEEKRQTEYAKRTTTLMDTARKITGRTETFEEQVEKGRKQLLEKAAAGAGENTQKRIKDELNYLLDHYTRTNDTKIELLIDKWRRSGDPEYDPAIKLRYRNVRKKKDREDYAL